MTQIKRNSKNRKAILELIRSTKTHPSAEWVYEKLHDNFPKMSLATVYRNIAQLKEAGLIRSLGDIDGHERLDGDLHPHSHAVCVICGKVYDLEMHLPEIKKTEDDNLRDLEILSADIRVSVICPECKKFKENKRNGQ